MLGAGDSVVVDYGFQCLFTFSCYGQVPQCFLDYYRILIFYDGANFKFNSMCPSIFNLRCITPVGELTLVAYVLVYWVENYILNTIHR